MVTASKHFFNILSTTIKDGGKNDHGLLPNSVDKMQVETHQFNYFYPNVRLIVIGSTI